MTDRHDDNLFIPAGLAILLALLIGFVPIPADPDLWFHLADGDYILSHGHVPAADPFSFTRQGELWVPHSWLFDVGATLAWRHLGPRTTEAFMALAFMLAVMVSFSLLVGRGVRPLVATAICLALAVGMANTRGIRPQVCSLLLCNLVVFLLVRHRYRPRLSLMILLPLIFLLWAQVHGACVVGLVVAAVWLGGRGFEAMATRALRAHLRELLLGLAALALSAAAILVTPHRITHYRYVALTLGLAELKQTDEWQAPRALSLEVPDVYIFLLIGAVVALLARRSAKIGWAEIGLSVSLMVLGLSGVRHIPLACIGAVPLVADSLARRETYVPARARGTRSAVAALATVAVALLVALWWYPSDIRDRYAQREPLRGARALADLKRDLRVFTTYNTGSYVLFAGRGRLKVFVDSRADVYGNAILAQAYRAMGGKGWDELMEEWKFDAAVVDRSAPIAEVLREHEDWSLLAEDPSALTFLHRPGGKPEHRGDQPTVTTESQVPKAFRAKCSASGSSTHRPSTRNL